MYLKGNADIILKKLEALSNKPPKDWVQYICKDDRFMGKYYWFKYVGDQYPVFYLYVPKTTLDNDKVGFMIVPIDNEDRNIIICNLTRIVHSLFDNILDKDIVLLEE